MNRTLYARGISAMIFSILYTGLVEMQELPELAE